MIIRFLVAIICTNFLLMNGYAAADNLKQRPQVTITIADGREIVMELYPEHAPQSVAQFNKLIQSGAFQKASFWRVEKDRLIQFGEGDPNIPYSSEYAIKGEFRENGVDNPLNFIPGTVAYGRLAPNSASGAIFITAQAADIYDGKYAAFGRVIEGLDVVGELSTHPSKPMAEDINFVNVAKDPVMISSISIEDNGHEFAEIEKFPPMTAEEIEEQMAKVREWVKKVRKNRQK